MLQILMYTNRVDAVHNRTGVSTPQAVSPTQVLLRFLFNLLLIVASISVIGLFILLMFLLFRRGEPTTIHSLDGKKFMLNEDSNIDTAPTSTAKVTKDTSGRRKRTTKEQGECQWLNFILKRAAAHFIFKHTAIIKKQLLSQLNKELHLPEVVGKIDIIHLDFGSSTPSFYSIKASEDSTGIQLDIELEFEDPDMRVELGTDIYINFPVKKFASLPVKFSLYDIYFHAKVRISISNDFSQIKISLLEEPDFDMIFTNEIGHQKKIKNLPFITDIINRAIYQAITKLFLTPKYLSFKLPPIVLFSDKNDEKINVATPATLSETKLIETDDESSEASEAEDDEDYDLDEEELKQMVKKLKRRKKNANNMKDSYMDGDLSDFLQSKETQDFHAERKKKIQ
jgi:hypothetical protein